MHLSAILKSHGHQCLVSVAKGRRLFKEIQQAAPDIIASSVTSLDYRVLLDQVKLIKNCFNIPVIFGGPHPTLYPDEVIKHEAVDMLCRGEGEGALLELAEAIEYKRDIANIGNLWLKLDGKLICNPLRPLIEDLDLLPFPDRELYFRFASVRNLKIRRFMAGRGCPYNCSFCTNNMMKEMYGMPAHFVRQRSVKKLVEEIHLVIHGYGGTLVSFSDDILALDTPWLQEFTERYSRQINLPFTCNTRFDVLNDKRIRLLKQAGCVAVRVGIESGNEMLRNKILNKQVSDVQILDSARLLKQAGIKIITYNLFGFPGEGFSDALETIRLNIRIQTHASINSTFIPFPGLPIIRCGPPGLDKNEAWSVQKNRQKAVSRIVAIRDLAPLMITFPALMNFFVKIFAVGFLQPAFKLAGELVTLVKIKTAFGLGSEGNLFYGMYVVLWLRKHLSMRKDGFSPFQNRR